MALPATDSFTDANLTTLTAHSASWTNNINSLYIYDNALFGATASAANLAHWNADSFNAAQYAQVKAIEISAAGAQGAAVRVHASAATAYTFSMNADDGWLEKVVATTWTQLGSTSAGGAANDVIRIEADGTTITPKKNGATTGTPGAQTDASIASGSAGVYIYDDDYDQDLDDFEGGNLAAAASQIKKLAGVAQAAVKVAAGVAAASIKKVAGVANT